MEDKLEKVKERITRDFESALNKKDDAGYVVWVMTTMVVEIIHDLEMENLKAYTDLIVERLGEVLDAHAKFLKLKEILGIDAK
jgi:hypothetical protein